MPEKILDEYLLITYLLKKKIYILPSFYPTIFLKQLWSYVPTYYIQLQYEQVSIMFSNINYDSCQIWWQKNICASRTINHILNYYSIIYLEFNCRYSKFISSEIITLLMKICCNKKKIYFNELLNFHLQ